MSVSGLQRLRKLQLGWQTSFSSNTSATKVLPYKGKIAFDAQLELPDVDVGSLDPVLPPFAGPSAWTSSWEGKLAYNDAPDLWAGLLKGGVAPTGATAKQHIFQAASLTQDPFPYATYQWGDDVVTDWLHGGGSVIDELTMGFDETLGAWDVSFNVLHARGSAGGPTGGLSADMDPRWLYGGDTEVFLDSVAASIGTTRLVDNVHTAEVQITANNDPKRFANGSNTRFQITNFGRGERQIQVTLGVAKTAATIAERQSLDDGPPPIKFIELRTTAPAPFITGSTPYSQSIRLPVQLRNVDDTEFGENNTGYLLTYSGRYDTTLAYAIRVVTVTTNGTTYP